MTSRSTPPTVGTRPECGATAPGWTPRVKAHRPGSTAPTRILACPGTGRRPTERTRPNAPGDQP